MVRTGVVNHPSEWNFGGYEEILKTKNYVRESKWSQSIAVGSKSFVEGIKDTSKFDKGAFLYPTLPLKVLKKLI